TSHPTVLFFHLLFRSLALLTYLFSSLLFSSFILAFVIIILFLAFDFWTVKNVSGRLLVGLRWWNEIRDDGTNVWIFESRENRTVNQVDSRIFWGSLYITPVIWGLFGLLAILRFSVEWFVVTVVAIVLNVANVIGYSRCEKVSRHVVSGQCSSLFQDAKQKFTNWAAGNNMVQSMVGNMISSRISSMFGSGGNAPPARG
ncbi:hypothetical protein BJ742DRAFT_671449, partial [Cladochytrium replicatum]